MCPIRETAGFANRSAHIVASSSWDASKARSTVPARGCRIVLHGEGPEGENPPEGDAACATSSYVLVDAPVPSSGAPVLSFVVSAEIVLMVGVLQ